jgi:hypothetical protein
MDNIDIKEVRQVLHMHEDINQASSSPLMLISSKIIELEQASTTHSANITSLLQK